MYVLGHESQKNMISYPLKLKENRCCKLLVFDSARPYLAVRDSYSKNIERLI